MQKLRGSALIINALPTPKFLKIVATRGEIFSLKFTKYRLAAGLCPDPLRELKRFPDPLATSTVATITGPTSKGRGRERRERDGRGRGGGTCSKVLGGIDAPVRR